MSKKSIFYDNHMHYFGQDLVEFSDQEDKLINFADYDFLTTQKGIMDAIKEDLGEIRSRIEEDATE